MLTWQADDKPVYAVAFSPNGAWLATGSLGHTVHLRDAHSGALVRERPSYLTGEHTLLFAGPRLLVLAGNGLKFVDVRKDGTLTTALSHWGQYHGPPVAGLAASPDGRFVGTTHRNGKKAVLRLYQQKTLERAEELVTDEAGPAGALAFAADGTMATGTRVVRVWQPGRAVRWLTPGAFRKGQRLTHRFRVRALAFRPDSRLLASADGAVVRLWQVSTGQEVGTLQGHAGLVTSVAWHPAGRTLASAGGDGTVRLWDVATGREREAFAWGLGSVACVTFAPDGMRAAACGDNGRVVVWDVDDA